MLGSAVLVGTELGTALVLGAELRLGTLLGKPLGSKLGTVLVLLLGS